MENNGQKKHETDHRMDRVAHLPPSHPGREMPRYVGDPTPEEVQAAGVAWAERVASAAGAHGPWSGTVDDVRIFPEFEHAPRVIHEAVNRAASERWTLLRAEHARRALHAAADSVQTLLHELKERANRAVDTEQLVTIQLPITARGYVTPHGPLLVVGHARGDGTWRASLPVANLVSAPHRHAAGALEDLTRRILEQAARGASQVDTAQQRALCALVQMA